MHRGDALDRYGRLEVYGQDVSREGGICLAAFIVCLGSRLASLRLGTPGRGLASRGLSQTYGSY